VKLVGAGRTDAGVHAVGQVAHFETTRPYPPGTILRGVNSLLPAAVRVLAAAEVDDSFHARHAALYKEYRYHLWDAPVVPPFFARYAWHSHKRLDAEAMDRAAAALVGTRDLSSLRAAGCVAPSPVRTVVDARVARHGAMVVLRLVAPSFLRHMVRITAGTLRQVGLGRMSPADFTAVLAACDRACAAITAPPHGLFLVRVVYDGEPGIPLERPPEPVLTFSVTTPYA
jgi:tRNA pseudouridine38-40 synthase